jgi:hypothetical protein
MGGATCAILIHAIVRFQSIPKDPAALLSFDEQMRACLSNDTIAQAIVNDTDDTKEVCAILEKPSFNHADRVKLWSVLAAYKAY